MRTICGNDQTNWVLEIKRCFLVLEGLNCIQCNNMIYFPSFITDTVQAIYDVWFVGDGFFREVFPALQAMQQQAKLTKSSVPYLYEYYNVFGYYSMRSSGMRYCIGRILNSLIVGLNTRERLPRLVVLIIDKDIIEDVGIDSNRPSDELPASIGWLFKQIEIVIKRKRMEIVEKKPGAVYSNDQKIMIVDMLCRPFRFPEGCKNGCDPGTAQ